MEPVKLTISGLRADVENGLTRVEIAAKYNLPVTQIKKAMEQANLKNAKPKSKPGFILIDDTATEIVSEAETLSTTTQEVTESVNVAAEKVENTFGI